MWKNFHSPFNLMIQIRFNSKLLSICLFVCVLCFLHFMSLCLVWIYVQSLCSILFFCCGDSQYKIVVSGLNQTIMCLMMIEKKRNLKEYQRWWWWWSSTTTIKFFFIFFLETMFTLYLVFWFVTESCLLELFILEIVEPDFWIPEKWNFFFEKGNGLPHGWCFLWCNTNHHHHHHRIVHFTNYLYGHSNEKNNNSECCWPKIHFRCWLVGWLVDWLTDCLNGEIHFFSLCASHIYGRRWWWWWLWPMRSEANKNKR